MLISGTAVTLAAPAAAHAVPFSRHSFYNSYGACATEGSLGARYGAWHSWNCYASGVRPGVYELWVKT